MFRPLLLIGISEHNVDVDNDAINKIVLEREGIKLSEQKGNTFTEDSYLPRSEPAITDLLYKIDGVIQKEVHPLLETYNEWAHILHPNEQTMFHSHTRQGQPPGISWVYYSKTPPNAGNIVWTFEAAANRVIQEATPEVGKLILFADFIPHFTKKNVSGDTRISISGNAQIPEEKLKQMDGMHNLFNYVGIFNGS